MTFCSPFHAILAFWQNRNHKQEVGHCDLIQLQIFFSILIILKIKGSQRLYTKLQPNIAYHVVLEKKVDFIGLTILATNDSRPG